MDRKNKDNSPHDIEKNELKNNKLSAINTMMMDSFFMHSPVMLYIVDLENYLLVRVNKEMVRVTGRSESELLSTPFINLVHPDDCDAIIQTIHEVMNNRYEKKQIISSQSRYISLNGEIRIIEWHAVPDFKHNLFYGMANDITGKKKAEKALKESENKFRSITENAIDCIFIKDSDRKYTFVNKAMQNLLGLPAHEIIGKTSEEIFGFKQGTSLKEIDECTFSGEIVNETKELIIGKKLYYLNTIQTPLTIEKNIVTSIMGIIRDVTDFKKADQNLLESESRFRSYIEAAPDGIFVIDEKINYVDVNNASCRITGYSRDELIGKSLFTVMYPEDHQLAKKYFKNIVTTGSASGELRIINKDGKIRHLVVEAVKLSDTRFLGFVKDITENKQLEEKLRHVDKMQAIGQLAGGIAHDFNNQLSGILIYTELLHEDVDKNPTLSQYVDNILTGIKRASDLTSQLLAFSHKGKYLNSTINIHRIISEVVNLLQYSINKNIYIQQELRANPSTTIGDPTQLQNAIVHLGLNARDAMPDGGNLTFSTDIVHLDKELCKRQSFDVCPGKFLKLSVIDTGIGMDEKIKERIFEPFFTTKDQGKGTGMGLAAVYGTVRNHKGVVTVTSNPGKGSTFTLFLPLVVTDEYQDRHSHLPDTMKENSAHILIVEDEELIRNATIELLKSLGYTVSACANGREAVEFYSTNWKAIDLVILDVIMPEMDGEKAFALMQEINPDIKAIVSSGYCIDGKARNIIERGAKGFLQKPYRMGDLSMKISEVLKEKVVE